jgi:hypothetical protein
LLCGAFVLASCADPSGGVENDPGSPPEAPVAIRVVRDDQTLIVKWEAVEGADSYEVYASWNHTDPDKADHVGVFETCRAELTNLPNGVTHYIWLRAVNRAGRSLWSAGAEGTPGIPPLPAAPRVHAPETAAGGTRISWEEAQDAVSYEVRYGAAAHPAEVGSNAVIATENTYCYLEGLAGFSGYKVWVRSQNSQGYSGYSAPRGGFFSSLAALAQWLKESAANTASDPYRLALEGVDLSKMGGGSNGSGPLFETFQGRYLDLDLDACTGATIGWGNSSVQTSNGRPDKDKLISLTLPSSGETRRVGMNSFEDCVSLVSVVFPPLLQGVGASAFKGCVSLEEADLPASLAYIDGAAFSGCSSLRTLIVRASSPPEMAATAFSGCPADISIRVPAGSLDRYKNAFGWKSFSSRIIALEEGG